MAELVFRVQADLEKVVQLRNEIEKLKSSLSGMNKNIDPSGVAALESKLQSAQTQMNGMVSSAAKAGESMKEQFAKEVSSSNGSLDKLMSTMAKLTNCSMMSSQSLLDRSQLKT